MGANRVRLITFLILGVGLLASYQNCGTGFQVAQNASTSGLKLDSNGNPILPPITTKPTGVTNDDFKACRATNNLFTCLESKANKKSVLKQADVTACIAVPAGQTATPSDFDVAMCITKSGFAIFGYREPQQSDVDTCVSKVGTANIVACLDKNGVKPVGLSQANVDTCVNNPAVGIKMVEKCLRKNGLLSRKGFVANGDITLCGKVTGQATSAPVIRDCLLNLDVIAAGVVADDLSLCMTNAPTTIAKCLRANKKAPRVIMQANLNACIAAVGNANIATCLEANGYLYDNLLPAATLQTNIGTCLTTIGNQTGTLARCMRTNGFLEKNLTQAHITACFNVVGQSGVAACLIANGLLTTGGVATNGLAGKTITQTTIDECVTAVTIDNVAKCLANPAGKAILSPTPTQDQFGFCHRLAGPEGVGTCLAASGMQPATLTQAGINTCLGAVGYAGLETCARARGFITN